MCTKMYVVYVWKDTNNKQGLTAEKPRGTIL